MNKFLDPDPLEIEKLEKELKDLTHESLWDKFEKIVKDSIKH